MQRERNNAKSCSNASAMACVSQHPAAMSKAMSMKRAVPMHATPSAVHPGGEAEAKEMRLKTYDGSSLTAQPDTLRAVMARPRIDFASVQSQVHPIIDGVRKRGDEAVCEYTEKFDKCKLKHPVVAVADLPWPDLPSSITDAFKVAYENIKSFHEAQASSDLMVETMPGVRCRRMARPINAVGLYVPGGTAVLPSSALMLAVPAAVAGCKTIVMATPPRQGSGEGTTAEVSISDEVLYCAKLAGVTHLLMAGGAQAIAAMAYGTETCPKVDKIFGPGNQYVTAAKMVLQNSEAMVGIDMPAGPSEVLVIADEGANPAHVAADLLSQAEHGPDSQVVLIAIKGVNLAAIQSELSAQCSALARSDFASLALEHSFAITVDNLDQAYDLSNLYAPEHLIVNVAEAEQSLGKVTNAGSVFLGRWTPESVGDYASGTNHVLPTYGYARMYSGVSLSSFQKSITVQSLTSEGLEGLGPTVEVMANVEGLTAHKQAVTLRLESIRAAKKT